MHLLPALGDDPAAEVDRDVAGDDCRIGRGLRLTGGVAQRDADARDEFSDAERLLNSVTLTTSTPLSSSWAMIALVSARLRPSCPLHKCGSSPQMASKTGLEAGPPMGGQFFQRTASRSYL
jgi:hypothetical protein